MQILIYNDEGCSDISVIRKKLTAHFGKKGVSVNTTNAEEIKNGRLEDDVAALVVPGGKARIYQEKLGDEGNNKIREYVKNGGTYFGICAGGYYSAKKIVFEKGVEGKEIIDDGIGLINGTAIGTLRKELNLESYDGTPESAAAVDIEWKNGIEVGCAYYHGGPYFDMAEDDEHEALAYYKGLEDKKPAIVKRMYGKGRVIATGVHTETHGNDLVVRALRNGVWDNETSDFIIKTLVGKDKEVKKTFNKLMHEVYQGSAR